MKWTWQWLVAGLAVVSLASVAPATVLRVPSEYPTIQAGIDAAVEGDTVLVADGTYTGDGNRDLDFGGVNMVVMSENGPELTVIDCEGNFPDLHRGFHFHNGEDSSSVVQGFTITNGFRYGEGTEGSGGAILCVDSSPTIRANIIVGNTASAYGGGIYCYDHSSASVQDCVIGENIADSGGGIGCDYECYVAFENNVITGNVASSGGGVMADSCSTVRISGSTITENRACYGGGFVCLQSSGVITNSILWADSAETGSEIYVMGSCPYFWASLSVSWSDVQGGPSGIYDGGCSHVWWEMRNIDADPLFVAGPHGAYYLSQVAAGQVEQSPCVDAGHPDFPVPEGTTRTDEVCDAGRLDIGYHYTECVVAVGEEYREEIRTLSYRLAQNYPNPFTSGTTIAYSLAAPTWISLGIYDIQGALVRNLVRGAVSAGPHQVVWDGRDHRGQQVAGGIYFCHISVGDHTETKRMVLLR